MSSMNYVICVVALNMVNFAPSLAEGAGPTGIKGYCFFFGCLQSYTIRAKKLVS